MGEVTPDRGVSIIGIVQHRRCNESIHTNTHTQKINPSPEWRISRCSPYRIDPTYTHVPWITDVPHTQKAQAGSRPITPGQETQMSSNKESQSALYHWKRDMLLKVKLFSDWIFDHRDPIFVLMTGFPVGPTVLRYQVIYHLVSERPLIH